MLIQSFYKNTPSPWSPADGEWLEQIENPRTVSVWADLTYVNDQPVPYALMISIYSDDSSSPLIRFFPLNLMQPHDQHRLIDICDYISESCLDYGVEINLEQVPKSLHQEFWGKNYTSLMAVVNGKQKERGTRWPINSRFQLTNAD